MITPTTKAIADEYSSTIQIIGSDKIITDNSSGYSVSIPKNWEATLQHTNSIGIKLIGKGNLDEGFSPNIILTTLEPPIKGLDSIDPSNPKKFKNLIKKLEHYFKKIFVTEGAIKSTLIVKIDKLEKEKQSLDFLHISYEILAPIIGRVKCLAFVAISNHKVYRLIFTATPAIFDRHQSQFYSSINSLNLFKPKNL